MGTQQLIGFGLILLGAICGGSFGLPSKYVKKDTPWEVLWGPFFFVVTLLIPLIVAPLVVHDLGGIYARVGLTTIALVLIFGFLWGLGSMTLGMSFAFIGLSLAYALNYGAQIIFGSMLPMVLFNADQIFTPHGYVILAGVAVCVVGVIVCGRAGILKERGGRLGAAASTAANATGAPPKMAIGLLIGVLSGVLCACYAVASAYAGPIGKEALASQNPDWAAAWAVTAMILWGGAVSSCLYCVAQLTKNKTWSHLVQPGAGWTMLLATVMALLHDAAIFFFGLGWLNVGDLGVPVGYPVFMSFAIIVGNVHGFRTGEWKQASRQSIVWIVVGISLLIVGVCILAAGKSMMP
jgi:L-rhamnose-H+ transport protein